MTHLAPQVAALKHSQHHPELRFYMPEMEGMSEKYAALVKSGRDLMQYDFQALPGAPQNVAQSLYCGKPVILRVRVHFKNSFATINTPLTFIFV